MYMAETLALRVYWHYCRYFMLYYFLSNLLKVKCVRHNLKDSSCFHHKDAELEQPFLRNMYVCL